ncbi:MAG: hypothetical protein ACK5JM_14785 [Rhodoblastus sp.]
MAKRETVESFEARGDKGAAGEKAADSARKAIAHLQQVALTLAADAARLNGEEKADEKRSEPPARKKTAGLPAIIKQVDGPGAAAAQRKRSFAPVRRMSIAFRRAWRGISRRMRSASKNFPQIAWPQVAVLTVVMLVVAGGSYLGLTNYLDHKEAQRLAGEELLRNPPESPVERELRGKIAELSMELQSVRAQINKMASEPRTAQASAVAANAHANAQTAARLDKMDKDVTGRFDKQNARLERLERIAADPIVTSAIAKSAKGISDKSITDKGMDAQDKSAQDKSAQDKGADAPVRRGLRTPDPTMKPNTYVLRSVRNGVAYVQTRAGILEVAPGDTIPGVGRVRSIEKYEGRWVLVMSDGYIDQDE